MRMLIVGAGSMGRWFGEFASDWMTVAVTDTDEAAANRAAADLGAVALEPGEAVSFPVVCTAVPMSATPEVIAEYGPVAERAFIDLSGSMEEPLASMRAHAGHCERISLHPLFAPENAPGNVPVAWENPGSITTALFERLLDAGYEPFETTPAEHDAAMETVQAKVHAAVLAYAAAAEPVEERFHTPVSARMQALLDFVLDGDAHVYADIQDRYAGAGDVSDTAARIAAADHSEFVDMYRAASDRHRRADE